MRTSLLLAAVSALLVVPWLIAAGGTVGMYADPEHASIEGDSDVYDAIWQFSWVKRCIAGGEDPRTYGGSTLAWHNMGWPSLMAAGALGWGYDLSIALSTLFTAAAGYLLARSWGAGRNGALIAALIMAWMPVRLIRVYQHYSVAAAGPVILALYTIRTWLKERSVPALLFSLPISLLAVSQSLQHCMTLALGWLLTVLFTGKRRWGAVVLSGAVPALGCVLALLCILSFPGALSSDPGMDWRESVYWGAELQSYFLPSFMGRPLVADWMPNRFEGVVSPGLTVAVMALIHAFRKRCWKIPAAIGAVMLLSMGPLFKLGGVPTPVPLPYMLAAKLPFISAARTPARLAILAGLAAAVAAGAFIERRKALTGWLLAGLVFIEIVPFSLNTVETTIPSFYSLGEHSAPVLEIPASPGIRIYSLFEAADGRSRIVKFMARGGSEAFSRLHPGLTLDPRGIPSTCDLLASGASTAVYNRWLFQEDERRLYDSVYAGLFENALMGDSLWIWRAP